MARSEATRVLRCGRASATQSAASASSASAGGMYRRNERPRATDARTSMFVKVIAYFAGRRSSQR